MYSGYNKFLTKHHGRVYSLATRLLYALQFSRRWAVARIRYIFAPGDDARWTITEAAWHVKYALFPQEGRI
jgi:Tfp pilus assembly protein FimT